MDQAQLHKLLVKCLLEEKTASLFLQKAFVILCEARPKTSFASLARKMGFSSRSFVRQIFLGTRQPNLKNYRQIATGLGLSLEATEYLGLKIEKEEMGETRSSGLSKRVAEAELRLRLSLKKNIRRIRKNDPVPFERWPFVYASLGDPSVGRSLKEVIEISGQDSRTCLEILDFMLKKNLISWDEGKQKYFAHEEMVEVGELGSSSILKNLYKLISLEALRRVDLEMNSNRALFHSSVFSVNEDQLPQLTKDLQDLLFSYATKSEDSNGKGLALLCASMIPMKSRKEKLN